MKKTILIAGLASAAAAASLMWSAPVSASTMCGSSACAVVHDRWPGRPVVNATSSRPSTTSPSGVPEPGMLPLLALGLGGVAFVAFRRKRAQAPL
ncbi:MAG: PEP-CTERM sorting domain-containing protein [Proteobacteria bacterium]|nr:PEP-CTERM sorting domain-containing protein [Pseudomonadota bacterium]